MIHTHREKRVEESYLDNNWAEETQKSRSDGCISGPPQCGESVAWWGLLPIAQDDTSTDTRNGARLGDLLTPEGQNQGKR